MSANIFIKPIDDYTADTSPIKSYVQQASTYISKKKNIPIEDAIVLVKRALKASDTKNPIVTFMDRGDNGDSIEAKTSLTHYISDNIQSNHIMVPSFTAYLHPSKKRSLHASFLEVNISSRNGHKKKAAEFKADKNALMHGYHNTLQKSKKVANNSLSGAYASVSGILYNPSAHYSLTSTTRTATSIANAITESMAAGNRHYREPSTILNHIMSLVTSVDLNKITDVIVKYNLYIPTVTNVMSVIRYSSDLYWENDAELHRIEELVKTLSDVERTAFVYVNDLFQLRSFNSNLVRGLFGKMMTRTTGLVTDPLDTLNNAEGFILNLVHHICYDDIRGMKVNYSKMIGTDALDALASTTANVQSTLAQYSDLLIAFFRTDSMPIGVAYIRDMLRRVTVLSDTDSTCATYQEWSQWYDGEVTFGRDAIALTASVMAVSTQAIEHNLRQYTTNMNVPKDKRKLITYKGEFYWSTMTPMSVSKHYFASVAIQEGSVFDKEDLELKGVNLIASNAPMFVQKATKDMIVEINTKVANNEKLELTKYTKTAADVERRILNELAAGSIDILKLGKIKESSGYKLDADKSPFIHHTFWSDVLASKYGVMDKPPYTTVKVPTTLKSKKKLASFIEGIIDEGVRNRLYNFVKTYNKEMIGTFQLPLIMVGEHGIPAELLPAIDSDRIVFDSLGAMYMVLEGIGFYRKENMKLMDMGY